MEHLEKLARRRLRYGLYGGRKTRELQLQLQRLKLRVAPADNDDNNSVDEWCCLGGIVNGGCRNLDEPCNRSAGMSSELSVWGCCWREAGWCNHVKTATACNCLSSKCMMKLERKLRICNFSPLFLYDVCWSGRTGLSRLGK